MVPYLLGRWLRRARPRWAERLVRPLSTLELAIAIAVFAYLLGSGALTGLRTVPPADWGAGLAFALIALGVGWISGGREPEVRRAFAVTAVARNLALGLVIAEQLFPDGAVQLALFAIWLMALAVDAVFAVAARGPRPSPQPA
jgi:predicted Na+-dependent transporter